MVKAIIDRPAMYEINNVEDLSLFILGYKMALAESGEVSSLMVSFREYLNAKLQTTDDVDWPRLIRYHAGGDHNSLKLFSKYFFAFLDDDKKIV